MAYANQGRPGPRVARSAARVATMKIAMMTVTTTPDAISVWLRSANSTPRWTALPRRTAMIAPSCPGRYGLCSVPASPQVQML
ncbi:hypothetical protein [Nonomuraea sp. NPDC003709]|uniref:hypothetical protein n=1 Tax=Nonomuraea sp. NPDC003709 TaxID=3154450 RepID=UPI0033ADA757